MHYPKHISPVSSGPDRYPIISCRSYVDISWQLKLFGGSTSCWKYFESGSGGRRVGLLTSRCHDVDHGMLDQRQQECDAKPDNMDMIQQSGISILFLKI